MIDFQQWYKIVQKQPFQQRVLEQVDMHMQKNKAGCLPNAAFKINSKLIIELHFMITK